MIRVSVFSFGLALLGLSSFCQIGLAQKDKPIKIPAEQLAKECAADPKAAQKKYQDKAIEVEGVVVAVYQELFYKEKGVEVWDVRLKGFEQGKKNWTVTGFFLPSSPAQDKAKKAKKGEKVAITGTFSRVIELAGSVTIEAMSIETR